jgi:hypothetical protein
VLGALVVSLQLAFAAAAFNPAPHTGGDNAGYVTLAYSLLERGAYLEVHDPAEPRASKYPPAYPAVLAAAMAVGARTWMSLKLLSLAFICLALLVAFLWIEGRRGAGFAFMVALILSLSDAFLWHTQWILSDPLFLALTLCCIWACDRAEREERSGPWLALGMAAAILAFFTRSAGLPLILAMAGWLAFHRRWRTLAILAVAFGGPATLWWLRTRGIVGAGYVAEFWMVDPYQPDLGTVGPWELLGRVRANVGAYVGRWIPGGLVGLRGRLVTVVGVGLTAFAAVGWAKRVRRHPGVAEIFTPLYLGLILLWPVIWAGDRFALPLYPIVLFYAGETLLSSLQQVRPLAQRAVVAASVLALLVPATVTWVWAASDAALCRGLIREAGPFACYDAAVQEYVKAAEWAGEHLEPGSVVYTRKPRLFYVLSGVKARVYPLTQDPAEFLDAALAGGTSHVVMDYLDRLGSYYLAPVIQGRTGAFCSLVGFGDPSVSRTEIFGVLAPSAWEAEGGPGGVEGTFVVSLRLCRGAPPDGTGSSEPPYSTATIPLIGEAGPTGASPDRGGGRGSEASPRRASPVQTGQDDAEEQVARQGGIVVPGVQKRRQEGYPTVGWQRVQQALQPTPRRRAELEPAIDGTAEDRRTGEAWLDHAGVDESPRRTGEDRSQGIGIGLRRAVQVKKPLDNHAGDGGAGPGGAGTGETQRTRRAPRWPCAERSGHQRSAPRHDGRGQRLLHQRRDLAPSGRCGGGGLLLGRGVRRFGRGHLDGPTSGPSCPCPLQRVAYPKPDVSLACHNHVALSDPERLTRRGSP